MIGIDFFTNKICASTYPKHLMKLFTKAYYLNSIITVFDNSMDCDMIPHYRTTFYLVFMFIYTLYWFFLTVIILTCVNELNWLWINYSIFSQIPEKKPLVRREVPEEVRAKVRRGSQKRAANPIKVLSEFQNPEDETI